MRRLWTMWLTGWVCVAGAGLGADAGGVASLVERPLTVAVAVGCFGDGSEDRARLGARLVAQHVTAEVGRPVEVRVVRSGEEAGQGAEVVMLTGDAWMLGMQGDRALEPVLQSRCWENGGGVWVLLVRAPFDRSAVSRGHVMVGGGGDGELPMLWLDGWRRSERLVLDPAPTTHRITREPKASLALLRTFFGKADACVVPEVAFVEACAENPEVAQRLRRVAASPPLPGAVVAVRRAGEPGGPELRRAVERLRTSPHGAALAPLLGTSGFTAFSFHHWPTVAALVPARRAAGDATPASVAAGPLTPPRVDRPSTP